MRKLARFLVTLAQYLAGHCDARDGMLALGLILLGGGAHAIYPAAGYLLPGAVLIAVAIFGVAP